MQEIVNRKRYSTLRSISCVQVELFSCLCVRGPIKHQYGGPKKRSDKAMQHASTNTACLNVTRDPKENGLRCPRDIPKSCRCHSAVTSARFDVASISFRFTSIPLRSHFDLTSVSLRFNVVLTTVSLRSHSGCTLAALWLHSGCLSFASSSRRCRFDSTSASFGLHFI